MMDYREYKEMLMNEMDMEGIDLESFDEFCKQTVEELADITESRMTPEEILENTGLEALKAAGLIAAGLVVTHVTMKYVVPFAMKKVRELKTKREQAKYRKQLDQYHEEHNEVER